MTKRFDFKLGPTYTQAPMRRLVVGMMVGFWLVAPLGVRAQTPGQPPAGGATQPPSAGSQQGGAVDIGEVSKLSNEEKQQRAERALVDERQALKVVTDILANARSSKDIVQLNCVNEKLTQIKGLLRISEDASSKMYDAIASATADVVNHEFTKIAVAHQKVLFLRAEAEQCVGELSVYTGDTQITVEVGPDVVQYDPTVAYPPPGGPIAPPVASQF
jgi:hypothetical protein